MDTFTLQEVTARTGLSEHTLRYYERIGLLEQVRRDHSSGHRRYTTDDVRILHTIACLRATGMSIEDMRKFRDLAKEGIAGAQEQAELFEAHREQLELELARKQQHLRYLELKVQFWNAVVAGDEAKAREIAAASDILAKRLIE